MPPGVELALGTAQLGMPYGIANTQGRPSLEMAQQIIAESFRQGIRYFDTAQTYGNSEEVLGTCFRKLGLANKVKVISKLKANLSVSEIESEVCLSRDRLGLGCIWGLLLHSESLLDRWDDDFGDTFRSVKRKGMVNYLGVSVYSPVRALQALVLPELDVIQVPANVFDRRMKRANVFDTAATVGKHVFVRSVYLQGLALMDCSSVPPFAHGAVSAFQEFCQSRALSRAEFALGYAARMNAASCFVLGAETPEQATENAQLSKRPPTDKQVCDEWDRVWPIDQLPLIDPSQWALN